MAPLLRALLIVATITITAGAAQLPSAALAAGLDAKGTADAREATRLFKQGSYEEAAKVYARLSVDYPDMPIFERNLGTCYYYLRRPEPALSNLRHYLARRQNIAADDKADVEHWIEEMENLRAQNAAATAAPPPVPPASSAIGEPENTSQSAAAAPEPAIPPAAPTPEAAPSQPPGVDMAATPLTEAPPSRTPIYKTWWFWTGATAVVVAGTVTAILLARRGGGTCEDASLACRGVK